MNWNFALTLGYLIPALNNPAQIFCLFFFFIRAIRWPERSIAPIKWRLINHYTSHYTRWLFNSQSREIQNSKSISLFGKRLNVFLQKFSLTSKVSLKAIDSTLTIQEIPRPTAYRIVVQTLRSSRPFFKGLSFFIHLTTRSSTLNPFPLLRKNWRLNYWVNMKTVHKSFHLRLFAIFSSIDVKQLVVRGGLTSHKLL